MRKLQKMLTCAICLILCISTILGHSSCGVTVSAIDYMEGFTRRSQKVGEVTDEFKTALIGFGTDIFRRCIEDEDDNYLVSPLSALICLAMITNGTANETLAEIEQTLGIKCDDLNEALYAYMSQLYTADDCKVALADSVWFNSDCGCLDISDDFLQTNADWYNAQVYGRPFDDSTKQAINNWVKENTDGMIDKIIEDKIPASTVMYLINTLLFDAKWQNEYESTDIKKLTFTSHDGTENKIDMMHSFENIYLENDNAVGVCKLYKGRKYCFVGILPNEGTDIYDYIAGFDRDEFTGLWNSISFRAVDTLIPEFEYGADITLTEILQDMGINQMFDGRADFSRIGKFGNGDLFCSDIKQKTKIEVNRNGTKAAAVTWAETKATSAEPTETKSVYLTRPFVYAIVDFTTGTPLFIGAYTTVK